MREFELLIIILIFLSTHVFITNAWWLMAQMSASKFPSNYCNAMPGLSRRQRSLCFQNPEATRALHKGLRLAVDECKTQFSHERWNCSVAGGLGLALKVASAEVAYLYAITAGGASHTLAHECARGVIPDCSCGVNPRKNSMKYVDSSYTTSSLSQAKSPYSTLNSPPKDFTWAGCSDNVKYANSYTRKFIDSVEKHHLDARALMNLHNNRVGRKVLAANQRRQCKCHGVSGSCVTKTCWTVVPPFDEFGSILKKKYQKAQQVIVVPDSNELMMQNPQHNKFHYTNIRSERDEYSQSLDKINEKLLNSKRYSSKIPAHRGDLVFLESSPDYCERDELREIQGTTGRECFSESECMQLCCDRGWLTQREFRHEPCQCKFIWCCDVKCETCIREVERRFCK